MTNSPPRQLVETAKAQGFTFVRRCRHGQIWRHQRTGKRLVMARAASHSSCRATRNALAEMRRAAT